MATEAEVAAYQAGCDAGYATGRKDGFDAGFQLAAQVEQRAAREALARYALEVLGKDAGDGAIDLGALGTHQAS